METTKDKVIRLRQENPAMALREIGETVGVSHENVRQILKKGGFPTRAVDTRPKHTCLNCHLPTKNKKYCSWECSKEYTHVTLTCPECGRNFPVPRSFAAWHLKSKPTRKFFCSHQCVGHYRGTNFGFGKSGFDRGGWKGNYADMTYDLIALRLGCFQGIEIPKPWCDTSWGGQRPPR